MRCYIVLRALLLELLVQYVSAAAVAATENIRAIYLFKDVLRSDTVSLKTSGFNTVLIFGVGILDNGDIMYYSNTPGSSDVLVASNGTYVGGDALAEKVRSFKTGDTSINRVEITTNAHHVRELVANPGTGPETRLFRNFAALKTAWDLDAVNNDDEAIYDVASTVALAKLLGQVGYKYTTVPYINSGFWATITAQINSGLQEPDLLLDRVYLQCYDGGASNNPISWQNTLGIKVVPLIWVINDSKPSQGNTAQQARNRFANWNSQGPVAGGGYWNDYDIEKMGLSYTEYADVLTSIFP
ncbi:hypothetical protein GGS23DRAFT_567602 [Durotheca rogersii]|uniref:uncharacterized protein n=1 Tax=Durotheca rogersii TaxID=419775 RepID=UPI00221EBD62|nr:uncharacterized protein GGS23DRAFT_567602 [Durotheca rogersii]KAI5863564.1 hypothetical protein GGS23DRAFT_567602 [Durotheca rogersii]